MVPKHDRNPSPPATGETFSPFASTLLEPEDRSYGDARANVRVRLITNPASDRRIADSADVVLARGVERPEEMEVALRTEFPTVRVVPGVVDGNEWRWYVYRDGRWVNSEREAAGKGGH